MKTFTLTMLTFVAIFEIANGYNCSCYCSGVYFGTTSSDTCDDSACQTVCQKVYCKVGLNTRGTCSNEKLKSTLTDAANTASGIGKTMLIIIICAAVGGFIICIGTIVLIWCCCCKKRNPKVMVVQQPPPPAFVQSYGGAKYGHPHSQPARHHQRPNQRPPVQF